MMPHDLAQAESQYGDGRDGESDDFNLPQRANGVLQRGVQTLVVVLGVQILYLGVRQIELRLSQLHDISEPEVEAAFREIGGAGGFVKPFGGDIDSLVCALRGAPSVTYVARDACA